MARMVERQPIADASAPVMTADAEAHMAEISHHRDDILAHFALGIERAAVAVGRTRPTIAAQVHDDHPEAMRQLWRQPMPHDVALGKAVQQEQWRTAAAGAGEDATSVRVDPVRGEAGKEIGDIAHGSLHSGPYRQQCWGLSVQPATARQPMSRRQKPPGQSMASTAA